MKKCYAELKARYLNLLTDFGFHKVFGTESNKDLLIDFLNQVIKVEDRITNIRHLVTEQWGNIETDRKAVFDIFCETKKGEFFIVEMQKAKQAYFRDRSIFYASLPILKQAPKGIWNFQLKAVYLVAILNFVIFDADEEHVVDHVSLVWERKKTDFSNKLKFTFIELPKFKKSEAELKTPLDWWLYLLKNLPVLENRPKTIQGEIFDKLLDLAEINQLTNKDMEKYEKSVLEYYDIRDAMNCARAEGIEKGIKEGRKEGVEKGIEKGIKKGIEKGIEKGREEGFKMGKIDIIQKCFQMDIPIEVIIGLTGYSREQIDRFKATGTL